MKHKIYVANSWRNDYYTDAVAKLREVVDKNRVKASIPILNI